MMSLRQNIRNPETIKSYKFVLEGAHLTQNQEPNLSGDPSFTVELFEKNRHKSNLEVTVQKVHYL